ARDLTIPPAAPAARLQAVAIISPTSTARPSSVAQKIMQAGITPSSEADRATPKAPRTRPSAVVRVILSMPQPQLLGAVGQTPFNSALTIQPSPAARIISSKPIHCIPQSVAAMPTSFAREQP